jgi:hypothetical protein
MLTEILKALKDIVIPVYRAIAIYVYLYKSIPSSEPYLFDRRNLSHRINELSTCSKSQCLRIGAGITVRMPLISLKLTPAYSPNGIVATDK